MDKNGQYPSQRLWNMIWPSQTTNNCNILSMPLYAKNKLRLPAHLRHATSTPHSTCPHYHGHCVHLCLKAVCFPVSPTDGSDHRRCCAKKIVRTRCMNWCRGQPVAAVEECALSYAKEIVDCFEEGKGRLSWRVKEIGFIGVAAKRLSR